MTLEAVVYQKGLFGNYDGYKDLYSMQENWSWDFNLPKGEQDYSHGFEESNGYLGYVVKDQQECCQYDHHDQDQNPWEFAPLLMVPSLSNEWGTTPDSSEGNASIPPPMEALDQCAATSSTRPKRSRVRSRKNKEEIESQRMTHIAVERNRRKQMNEYLSVIKSLMPESYVQRSDQASIVGGAINYVKELEQNLQCLSAQKTRKKHIETPAGGCLSPLPFGEFFSFPQYSTMTDPDLGGDTHSVGAASEMNNERGYSEMSSVADVEVSMVETHANMKIRLRRHPKQLLKVVSGLQSIRLTILHLNISTVDQFALYSFSVKVEDDSKLTSVDEVATAVHQLLGRIQEETRLS